MPWPDRDDTKRAEYVAGLRNARAVIAALRERLTKEQRLDWYTGAEMLDLVYRELSDTIQEVKR